MMTFSQFQKVQDVPEVKAAREAVTVAQKKLAETVMKAAESGKGTVASAPKITPITIQVPPTGSTNGVGKRGM
jgi:hypothetical protein